MRQREDFPTDPEIVSTLEAIDATLAGEAVDPRHAELAELALLLTADRPVIEEDVIRRLDERVRTGAVARGKRVARGAPRRRRARVWVWAPAGAVAASLIAAVVIVAGQGGGGASSAIAGGTTASRIKAPAGAKERLHRERGGVTRAFGCAHARLRSRPGGCGNPGTARRI